MQDERQNRKEQRPVLNRPGQGHDGDGGCTQGETQGEHLVAYLLEHQLFRLRRLAPTATIVEETATSVLRSSTGIVEPTIT